MKIRSCKHCKFLLPPPYAISVRKKAIFSRRHDNNNNSNHDDSRISVRMRIFTENNKRRPFY